MLAFDVINLEQHRALQQNAERVYPRRFRGSELPLIVRPSSGPIVSKLNRQIPELEHPVTRRKQTADTRSNRQKFQKRLCTVSRSTSLSSARDRDASATRKMARPPSENEEFLQSARTISTRFWPKNRSYRKQTTKPFLPGATTACSETAFRGSFRTSAAPPSDQLKLHSEAAEPPSQSSNLSETYGRS
jgi:hypothetical protein